MNATSVLDAGAVAVAVVSGTLLALALVVAALTGGVVAVVRLVRFCLPRREVERPRLPPTPHVGLPPTWLDPQPNPSGLSALVGRRFSSLDGHDDLSLGADGQTDDEPSPLEGSRAVGASRDASHGTAHADRAVDGGNRPDRPASGRGRRELNERRRSVARTDEVDEAVRVPFLCECTDDCPESVRLSLATFDVVAGTSAPICAHGHDDAVRPTSGSELREMARALRDRAEHAVQQAGRPPARSRATPGAGVAALLEASIRVQNLLETEARQSWTVLAAVMVWLDDAITDELFRRAHE